MKFISEVYFLSSDDRLIGPFKVNVPDGADTSNWTKLDYLVHTENKIDN